ncbi:MAG: metallophosphoesterase [Spirochaetales bacterium]|nr:metallophosphoesterase [Spirochaetales bacterium]
MGDLNAVIGRLRRIAADPKPPSADELASDMEGVCEVLADEDPSLRPRDESGRPGGLIRLRPELPAVVVPDIHARVDLMTTVLSASFPEHGIDVPLLSALAADRAQLVMVGDYVHGEARARARWVRAFEEFTEGYRHHAAMDEEMRESLAVLRIVAVLKSTYPDRVHGLKGNHENITNEEGAGNHRFGKFVYEGAMVAAYMQRFYRGEATEAVYRFEKSLPLMAVGARYVVTHAEPERLFRSEEIVEYRDRPDVVEGLTWTDNDAAQDGSVAATLAHYLPHCSEGEAIHLGGHRPVTGRYALRAGGRYVQFHNPSRLIVALPPANRRFDPERDVVELPYDEGIFDGKDG